MLPGPGDELSAAASEQTSVGEVTRVWTVEETDVRNDHQVLDVGRSVEAGLSGNLIGHSHDPTDRLTVSEQRLWIRVN